MNETTITSRKIRIPSSVVNDIHLRLTNCKEDIAKLPNRIDKIVNDGSYDIFTFLGKHIRTIRISQYLDEAVEIDSNIYTYQQTTWAENKVLQIFADVCDLLEPFGLVANFNPHFSCYWNEYTVFDIPELRRNFPRAGGVNERIEYHLNHTP